jgi:hypothetical protein
MNSTHLDNTIPSERLPLSERVQRLAEHHGVKSASYEPGRFPRLSVHFDHHFEPLAHEDAYTEFLRTHGIDVDAPAKVIGTGSVMYNHDDRGNYLLIELHPADGKTLVPYRT